METSCVMYSPAENKWTEGPSMIVRRSLHSLLVIRGSLFAVGDVWGSTHVERLDDAHNRWEVQPGRLKMATGTGLIVAISASPVEPQEPVCSETHFKRGVEGKGKLGLPFPTPFAHSCFL